MALKVDSKSILGWLKEHGEEYIDISDQIWANPETNWGEYFASNLQADFLEKQGFRITRNPADMETAFVAEWGEGKPILAYIGEYDALPGLSQKPVSKREPVEEGAAGQGCGHNILGAASMAAAVALQNWMKANDVKGTVRYYGCPAEEIGGGKVYFARDGYFDDLDAALSYHPGVYNMASLFRTVAIVSSTFYFKGRSAHAGSAPHMGRSALDAVELMDVGANFMREHVKDGTRIQYVIKDGGQAPNIVPETASVNYYLRAEKVDYLLEVAAWLSNIAKGAAMMTGTEVEEVFETGFACMIANKYLAELTYEVMETIGPIKFTKEEIEFAQQINDQFPGENADYIENRLELLQAKDELAAMLREHKDESLIGANFPPLDGDVVFKGATDVGDLSQITPTGALWTTCFPTCTPGHSWASTATDGMSIGHKGLLHAAKILAITGAEMMADPKHFKNAQAEFKQMMGGKKYQPLIPADMKPPLNKPVK